MTHEESAMIAKILIESANNKVRLKIASTRSRDHQHEVKNFEDQAREGVEALAVFLNAHPIPAQLVYEMIGNKVQLSEWLNEVEHVDHKLLITLTL